MHLRRIAAFLLGAWLAGSVLVLIVCYNNSASIDLAIENTDSEAKQFLAQTGNTSARMFLGSLVAMENSRLLSGWELTQAPLGVLIMVMLFFERPSRLLVALPILMLLLVGFEHLLITPEIAWLSQALVFVPDNAGFVARAHLDNMHRIYGFTEVVKLLVGAALGVLLFMMRSGRRSHRSSRVNANNELLERRAAV